MIDSVTPLWGVHVTIRSSRFSAAMTGMAKGLSGPAQRVSPCLHNGTLTYSPRLHVPHRLKLVFLSRQARMIYSRS